MALFTAAYVLQIEADGSAVLQPLQMTKPAYCSYCTQRIPSSMQIHRSFIAAYLATIDGFTKVSVLRTGFKAWQREGRFVSMLVCRRCPSQPMGRTCLLRMPLVVLNQVTGFHRWSCGKNQSLGACAGLWQSSPSRVHHGNFRMEELLRRTQLCQAISDCHWVFKNRGGKPCMALYPVQ